MNCRGRRLKRGLRWGDSSVYYRTGQYEVGEVIELLCEDNQWYRGVIYALPNEWPSCKCHPGDEIDEYGILVFLNWNEECDLGLWSAGPEYIRRQARPRRVFTDAEKERRDTYRWCKKHGSGWDLPVGKHTHSIYRHEWRAELAAADKQMARWERERHENLAKLRAANDIGDNEIASLSRKMTTTQLLEIAEKLEESGEDAGPHVGFIKKINELIAVSLQS